jgi:hypothetical protein
LRLQVILDDHIIWDDYPQIEIQTITHDFEDARDGEHVLELKMQGKRPEHTCIDPAGNIIQDRYINISNFAFDEIQLGHMFTEVTRYYHDHNGTTEPIEDRFFGTMGCNGRVELRFSTPIYLWLLENM